MSLHVLLLLLFHWHLPPPTVRDQVLEQKCWAQVSMDNPIQCRVGYFKKRDSLSSWNTETYFSAVELLLQPVFYWSIKMHITCLPWAHSIQALEAACLSCRELLSYITGCQYSGLLSSRTARAMLCRTATDDFAYTKQGRRYEHSPKNTVSLSTQKQVHYKDRDTADLQNSSDEHSACEEGFGRAVET